MPLNEPDDDELTFDISKYYVERGKGKNNNISIVIFKNRHRWNFLFLFRWKMLFLLSLRKKMISLKRRWKRKDCKNLILTKFFLFLAFKTVKNISPVFLRENVRVQKCDSKVAGKIRKKNLRKTFYLFLPFEILAFFSQKKTSRWINKGWKKIKFYFWKNK